MKLTKKSFAPNIEVKVLDKSISFAGATYSRLEGFEVTDNLANISQNRWFNVGDILITDKLVNVSGSARAIFHVKGEVKQYQSFWFDFSNLTSL